LQADTLTDFLIIGAGFSGLVIAERLASAGWKCVVADRRSHLGGNAHDRYYNMDQVTAMALTEADKLLS
jgi:UDP-galactopyranose mutase